MPRPNLIHPIQVTIELLDRSNMIMDTDAREPIHGMRSSVAQTKTIPAQINMETADDPDPQAGGSRKRTTGYILCRLFDMDNFLGAGVRLKMGDKITAMGVLTGLDLYITKTDPAGHYPDQNGTSMVRYHFSDRKPVQQKGNL